MVQEMQLVYHHIEDCWFSITAKFCENLTFMLCLRGSLVDERSILLIDESML